jgi:hypothetical protein
MRIEYIHVELAATSQQQTATDEGKDPDHHRSSHPRPQSRSVEPVWRCHARKVMHRVSEVQRSEQDSNSAQYIQNSRRRLLIFELHVPLPLRLRNEIISEPSLDEYKTINATGLSLIQ